MAVAENDRGARREAPPRLGLKSYDMELIFDVARGLLR
jgi:hypothetical protein